jgi:hypothetical protein
MLSGFVGRNEPAKPVLRKSKILKVELVERSQNCRLTSKLKTRTYIAV